MAASPENFTLDSGHYENMPLNAELLEHFTQFARAVQKHDGTPAELHQSLFGESRGTVVLLYGACELREML